MSYTHFCPLDFDMLLLEISVHANHHRARHPEEQCGDTLYLSVALRCSSHGEIITVCPKCQNLQQSRDTRLKARTKCQASDNDSSATTSNSVNDQNKSVKCLQETPPIIVFNHAHKRKQIRGCRVLVFLRVTCSCSHHKERQGFECVGHFLRKSVSWY
jgi:hypothetical protein